MRWWYAAWANFSEESSFSSLVTQTHCKQIWICSAGQSDNKPLQFIISYTSKSQPNVGTLANLGTLNTIVTEQLCWSYFGKQQRCPNWFLHIISCIQNHFDVPVGAVIWIWKVCYSLPDPASGSQANFLNLEKIALCCCHWVRKNSTALILACYCTYCQTSVTSVGPTSLFSSSMMAKPPTAYSAPPLLIKFTELLSCGNSVNGSHLDSW